MYGNTVGGNLITVALGVKLVASDHISEAAPSVRDTPPPSPYLFRDDTIHLRLDSSLPSVEEPTSPLKIHQLIRSADGRVTDAHDPCHRPGMSRLQS